MTQVQRQLEDLSGLGPSFLAAIPFGLLSVISMLAPIPWAGPRLATTLGLGALAAGLAAVGWPRRNPAHMQLPLDADAPLVLSRQGVLRLGMWKDRSALTSHAKFTLQVLDDRGQRKFHAIASDPARLLQVAMRWSQTSGCRVEVEGWSIIGDPLPDHFEPFGDDCRCIRDDLTKLRFHSPLARWLGIGGGLFVLGLICSLVNAHLARSGLFTGAGALLGVCLGCIALFLLHLGLADHFWIESDSVAPSPSAAPLAARPNGRLWQGGIGGARVRLAWTDDTQAIWLISAGIRGRWHLLRHSGTRIDAVAVSAAALEP